MKTLNQAGTLSASAPSRLRNRYFRRAILILCVSVFNVSCVRSPVPQMQPGKLEPLDLVHMRPRTVKLTVVDERPVSAVDKIETEKNVEGAFGTALSAAHIDIDPHSTNELFLRLVYPEEGAQGMSNTSCAEIRARLNQGAELVLTAKSVGCAQSYNQLGMSTGSNAGPAFQEAAQSVIAELDRLSQQIEALKELPEFSVEKIVIPALPLGASKSVAVVVKDLIGQDAEWAGRLETELGLALRAAGYRPDPEAAQRIEVTLSRPEKDVGSRSRDTCVQYSIVLEVEPGQGRGSGSSCRGTEESKHHESFNDVLALVVSEIEKLPGQ